MLWSPVPWDRGSWLRVHLVKYTRIESNSTRKDVSKCCFFFQNKLHEC